MRVLWAAAYAIGLSAPAGAEVIQSSADHFVTRDTATVKADPKATWLALISPGDWWNGDHTWSGEAKNLSITPQGGGCFCERLPEEETATSVGLAGSAQHMTVVMAEPAKVLRMRGALGPLQSEPVDGVLTITMQPDKASGGTKIVWEYVVSGHMRFEVPAISKAVDGVMSEQLGNLAGQLGRVAGAARAANPVTKPASTPADKSASDDNVGEALDKMSEKDG